MGQISDKIGTQETHYKSNVYNITSIYLYAFVSTKLTNILKWFKTSCPGAKPNTLQCIALGQDVTQVKMSVEGRALLPNNYILGVTIDKDL